MNLEKYYEFALYGIDVSLPEKIVFNIMKDMLDRGGFGETFHQCDEDIQDEIILEWINIVKNIVDVEN